MEPTFKYSIGQKVKLVLSEEAGVIVGRAEYCNSDPSYLCRLRVVTGGQAEAWYPEDAIELV